MGKKKILIDISLSVAGIILAIIFKGVSLSIVDPDKLNNDPIQLFAIQFDLLIIGLTLIAGTVLVLNREKWHVVVIPFFYILFCILLILLLAGISMTTWQCIQPYKDWLTIWIPNILGITVIALTIISIRE